MTMSQTSAAVIVPAMTASIYSSTAGALIPVISDSMLSTELMLKLHHSLAVNWSLSRYFVTTTARDISTNDVDSSVGEN